MSRPIEKQSHDRATATGPGEACFSKGHSALALAVYAENLDTSNDSLRVRLEVEAGGTWHAIHDEQGNRVGELTVSNLESDGTGMLYLSNVPAPRIRANVVSFTDAADDDLAVDTFVLGTGWYGPGLGFET